MTTPDHVDAQTIQADLAAVAWTLRNPAVTGAIAGFRRPGQVAEILAGVRSLTR